MEVDPIRKVEHTTFTRLLYRNRNQHRHGLYFRRLEHVRRSLRSANNHVAWESVRKALRENASSRAKPSSKLPLSLSTLTLDDLKSIEESQEALVTKVIPKAAVKVVLELVCREHFLPFAIAVIAILARLFVIEQKVLSELRGAFVETKLLLGADIPRINSGTPGFPKGTGAEDIGEVVEAPDKAEQDDSARHDENHKGLESTEEDNDSAARDATLRVYNEPNDAPKPTADQKPSLYELMAEHDSRIVTAIPAHIRLAASVPGTIVAGANTSICKNHTAPSMTLHKNLGGTNEVQTERRASRHALTPEKNVSRRNCSPDSDPDMGKVVDNKVSDSDASDEDEDELDDIFDAMGD